MNEVITELEKALEEKTLAIISWENEYVPEAGITGVTKQLRKHYKKTIIVSPYFPKIAKKKLGMKT